MNSIYNFLCILDDICTIKANKNINSSIRSWTIILFEKALFVCKKTKNTSQFDHLIDLSEYTFSINRNRNIQEPATPSSASNNPIFLFFNPTNLEQNTLSLNHIKEPNKNYNLTFKVKIVDSSIIPYIYNVDKVSQYSYEISPIF